jgi:ferredoxin
MKEYLHNIGVPEMLVRSESFVNGAGEIPEIETADVAFSEANSSSKTRVLWEKAKPLSLLEAAEAAGLAPDYGCRVGACGSCKAKLVSGKVVGGMQPDGTVLLCTARPASVQVEIEI